MIDGSELRKGIARTWPFLLSHHVPGERYRCYAPGAFGRRVYVCARCSGIYPGIAAGAIAGFVATGPLAAFSLVVLLPLPALVDWALTTFTDRRGYNVVRTATGFLLGYGYGLGLALLFGRGRLAVLAVGFAYAFGAASLIYLSKLLPENN